MKIKPVIDRQHPRRYVGAANSMHILVITLALHSGLAVAAADQTNPTDDTSARRPPDSEELSEVVVTARLRSENLMRVPDSIVAFSADDIANRQLTQISDYFAQTPNARITREQDIATNEVYIRGVGSNKGQASAVAFVLDGVTLPDGDAYTMDLSDADHVEILKGPQGALYGKGAIAGVINVKTRDPTNTFTADAKLDVGSNNTVNEFIATSGPLISDTLLGALSIKHVSTDGPYNNAYNGTGIMRDDSWRLATKMIARPNDVLSFQFAGSYYTQHAGNPAYNGVDVLGTGNTEITSAEAAAPISHNSPDDSQRKVYTAALTSSLDLAAGRLISITAFDKIQFHFVQDLDFTALDVATASQPRDSNGASEEIRFVSRDDMPFRYIVSGYYEHTRKLVGTDANLDLCFLGVVACATPPGVVSGIQTTLPLQNTDTKTNEYAAAAQASYDITRQIELTLAIRHDSDEVNNHDLINVVDQRTTYADWEPKASLAIKPNDQQLVYLTYSHGYKPGLFNVPQAAGSPFPERVKQEGTDNLELGTKYSPLNHKLILTAATFYTNYKNAQEFHLDIQSGGNQAINVNDARIWGFEADALARPLAGVDLNASFGYTKSDIRDFNGTQNYVGQSLPYQPLYSLSLGAQYTTEVAAGTLLRSRIDYTRHGKTSFQDFQDPNPNQFLYQSSDQTVDLSTALVRGSWTLTLYGKNVLNERYVYSAYSRYISALIFAPLHEDILLPAPGVTYGAEIRWAF
jgi:iron complex outermembrane recepter protein